MTDALSPLAPPAALAQVGVALATHGKIPWRLAMVVDAWCALGVPVVVAAPQDVLHQLGPRDGLIPLPADTRPGALGDAMQAAIDAVPRSWALLGADDILPVPHTWRDRAFTLEPGTIQAVELRSELNQRWGDWAAYDGTHIVNQPSGRYRPGTFIAGGAQLISPEARRAVSYRGRRYHDGDDIRYCWDAVMAGIRLRPADPGGPLLLHLDRFPPHPSDPERLGAPLAFGPAAADVARFGELVFRIRPNTWDAGILREVILADTYDLNLWRPPPRGRHPRRHRRPHRRRLGVARRGAPACPGVRLRSGARERGARAAQHRRHAERDPHAVRRERPRRVGAATPGERPQHRRPRRLRSERR